MALKDWEQRHTVSNKEPAMAKRKVKMLLNLGTDHQKQYGLPELVEDEVASVTDEQADILVNVLKIAKEHNAAEEKEHAAEVREGDVAVLLPEAEARVAREAVEKAADKEARKK
jgi:hypothetical protein